MFKAMFGRVWQDEVMRNLAMKGKARNQRKLEDKDFRALY